MRAFVPFASILVLLSLSTLSASADGGAKLCSLDLARSVSGIPRYTSAMPEATAVPWFVAGDHVIKIQRGGVNPVDWPTCQSTLQDIGPNDSFGGTGGMSADGTTAVCFLDRGPNTPVHACTFSVANGLADLGTLGAASLSSFGFGANADGSVVVGAADIDAAGNPHAFRWTAAEGMVDLSSASGPTGSSRAFATSGDGSAVVGESDFPGGQRRAFLWTQAGGFQDLDASGFGMATAISGDGRTVVGQNLAHAFRWTADEGLRDLQSLPGRSGATATGVSDNGNVVVGMAAQRPLRFRNSTGWDFDTSDTRAFRWTAANGMQDLAQVLTARGVDLTGITLIAALTVSPDGQFIGGAMTTNRTQPNETVGFIAQVCDEAVTACAP